MKWIGQHIYDLASRFRNDVFLEDISTGTIASGAHLGLDSNNKIVKAVDGGGDITGVQLNGGTGIDVGNVSNASSGDYEAEISIETTQPSITTLAGLTSFGVAGATTNIAAGDVTVYNTVNDGNPTISLGSSATNRFEIKTTYNSGAQTLDEVQFNSYTTSTTTHDGRFIFQVDEVELIRLLDSGIVVQGGCTVNGDGATITTKNSNASSATEGGNLKLSCDDGAAMGDDHRLGVIEFEGAEDASNTRVVGASIQAMCDAAWSASENGTRLEFYTMDGNAASELSLTLDSDLLATFAGGVTVTGTITGDVTGDLTGLATTATHVTVNDNESTNENNVIPFLENATANGNSVGLESDGDLTYNPSTGKVTATGFVGALTGDVTGDLTGEADTVATIAGLAPNTATTQATQPAIESIGTDGDTLRILSDQLEMSNATASMPTVKLTNTTDDNGGPELIFEKLRDDDAVAPGQNLGEIWFRGQDSAQSLEDYAYIIGEIDVSTDGQESGQLALGVANHDGGNGTGLKLTGGSANDEIDVVVGLGTASTTTIAGTLSMGLTAAIDANGAWVGGVIPSAKLDADTAHLAGTQTFTGTKTLNSFKGTAGATVTNILDEDAMGSDSATALATQQSIKAYVDGKYTYTYTSFIGISDIATNWAVPHQNGWNAYANTWNTDTSVSATSIDTTISVSKLRVATGFTIPFDGILVGFYATVRNADNNNQAAVGLFHQSGSTIWGVNGSTDFALKAYAAASFAGGSGSSYKGACKVIDLGRSLAVTAGDVILPAVLEASTDKVYCNITMVIKTLIP